MAKLFNLAKNSVEIAGIFAQQAALEHQCIGRAATVAHLAVATNSLVRIQANNRRAHAPRFGAERRARHTANDAHIANPEFGRTRMGVDIRFYSISHMLSQL